MDFNGPTLQPCRNDISLLREQITKGWKISPEVRELAIEVLREGLRSRDAKTRQNAAKLLNEFERLNIEVVKEEWKRSRIEGGQATEIVGSEEEILKRAREIAGGGE